VCFNLAFVLQSRQVLKKTFLKSLTAAVWGSTQVIEFETKFSLGFPLWTLHSERVWFESA